MWNSKLGKLIWVKRMLWID